MATKELSWKPVLTGNIYCSPACGCGCTIAAFDKATEDAAALAKRLGDGWVPEVSENLGWHYAAVSACGRWKVHPCIFSGKVESYSAFLGDAGTGGGIWTASADTPEAALAKTRVNAMATIERYASLLDLKLVP